MPIDHRLLATCGALSLLAGCPAELSPATGSGEDSGTTSPSSGDAPPGNDADSPTGCMYGDA